MPTAYILRRVLACILAVTSCSLARAAPEPHAGRGEMLYENHCIGCHDSVLHVRADRRVDTRAGVAAQVRRWSGAQGLQWNEGDIEEVTEFLDRRYYRLERAR